MTGLINSPSYLRHRWKGVSGAWYDMSAWLASTMPPVSGVVYIFGRARPDGLFDPLYCGQSGEGAVRFNNHEKMARAMAMGLTHIHLFFESNKDRRFQIETDLRHMHKPPLNEQGVPSTAPDYVSALGGLFTGGLSGALNRGPSLYASVLSGLALHPAPLSPAPDGLLGIFAPSATRKR